MTEKKMSEFHHSMGKGQAWKESGVIIIHGKREVKVGTLFLGNDKNNVIANKVLSCF